MKRERTSTQTYKIEWKDSSQYLYAQREKEKLAHEINCYFLCIKSE